MWSVRSVAVAALFLLGAAALKPEQPEGEKQGTLSPTPGAEEKHPAIVQGEPNIIANEVPERDKTPDQPDQAKAEVEAEADNATSAEPPTTEQPEENEDKVMYDGMKVLRVVVQSKEQKRVLRELETKGEINRWLGNGTAVDILIKKASVVDYLKEKQLSYDVVIEDLQQAINDENPKLSEEELTELSGRNVEPYSEWERAYGGGMAPHWGRNQISYLVNNKQLWFALRPPRKKVKKGYRLTWQQYHRMTDIHSYLDFLVANYPQMVSMETIGHSVEGKPLKVLKISSGEPNSPGMWVDAGIHAREWITPATATYVIHQIVEGGDGPQGVDWYFLPLVNPDGYEHAHRSDRLWRKNRANPEKGSCAGTDLNRNFGYRWGGQGASRQPCRETYAGTGPFSEPETSAINRFITGKQGQVKAYVSLHSYGQYILYPWGYDRKVPPDYSDLDRVGREMAQAMRKVGGQSYTVGSAASTLYPASGGSDDWAKGTAKVKYSFTIELRDTGRHGFILPAQYIVPTAKEAYAALRTLAGEVKQLKKRRKL